MINKADYSNYDTFLVIDKLVELLSERKGIAENPWLIWYRGVQSLQNMSFDQGFLDACFKGQDPQKYLADINLLTQFYLTIGKDDSCC